MWKLLVEIARTGQKTEAWPAVEAPVPEMQAELRRILGRALTIRHVDAGSCNGCELEIQALNNPYYNLEGAGIRFVASPRHADLLLVTGPVTVNMEGALRRTYEAAPEPKFVIAVGDCGACGGIFGTSYASRGGVSAVLPVDLTVPGCPPPPRAILAGILAVARGGGAGMGGLAQTVRAGS